jgi:hypothetical protein
MNLLDTRKISSISRYSFAYLLSIGPNHVFDVMRYENAFFNRRFDVELIKQVMHQGLLANCNVLIYLGKYGCVPWTHERLLSYQKLVEIDTEKLHYLNAKIQSTKAPHTFRYAHDIQVTGLPNDILDAMYENQASPATEGDSAILERMLQDPDSSVTVVLTKYTHTEDPSWQK